MYDRDYYLNHVTELTPEEIFEGIRKGIVGLEDLILTGKLDRSIRLEVRNMLENLVHEENNYWKNCKGLQDWREYLLKYPTGKYCMEAFRLVANTEKEAIEKAEEKEKLKSEIRQNHNKYRPGQIKDLIEQDKLSVADLLDVGIPHDILNTLYNYKDTEIRLGSTPDSIPLGFTEVYFWGIPGSGKTCALGAILNTAESKGYLEIGKGTGFDYMLQLKNIFADPISILPGSTPEETTQYLPFTLRKSGVDNPISVSLIELSGEIFKCFLRKLANIPLTERQEETFTKVVEFLNSPNPKIHFFFVDYEHENRTDSGYRQSDYLSAAASFFNNPGNNLFTEKTNAIYVVLTKSDLMDCPDEDRIHNIKEYLSTNNYSSFINVLRSRCQENSINGKRLLGIEFSLGQLYFKDFCRLNSKTSESIIDILLTRISPKKDSVLDFLNQ